MQDFYLYWSIFTLLYWYFYLNKGSEYFFQHCSRAGEIWRRVIGAYCNITYVLCSQVETPSGTLGPFCGNTPPPSPLLTHSNEVQIHFTSDSFGTNKGFSLHFKTRGTAASSSVPAGTVVEN